MVAPVRRKHVRPTPDMMGCGHFAMIIPYRSMHRPMIVAASVIFHMSDFRMRMKPFLSLCKSICVFALYRAAQAGLPNHKKKRPACAGLFLVDAFRRG